MSAIVHFSVKYDGPALASGQMDARELALTIIALGELLEQANRAAFPGSPDVRVVIDGDFKSGEFEIDVVPTQSVAQQVADLLAGRAATTKTNGLSLLDAIGFASEFGLIGVLKWLRGRTPSSIRSTIDATVFEFASGQTVEVFSANRLVGVLYHSPIVRQSLARVIKPLERDGIDALTASVDGRECVQVTKADVSAFLMTPNDVDVVSDTTSHGEFLRVASVVLKRGNIGRFHDGLHGFAAEIADQNFLARIRSGQGRFCKSDMLVVDLRRIQTIADGKLKIRYQIVKVHENKSVLQLAG